MNGYVNTASFENGTLEESQVDTVAGGSGWTSKRASKEAWNGFADRVNRPLKEAMGDQAQILPTFDS